jgi:hypothetical protein
MPPPSSRCSPPSFVAYKSPGAAAENPSLPFSLLLLSRVLSCVGPETLAPGHRLTPLFSAAPCSSEHAMSSALPSSFLSPEESAAGASNRRRCCHFPCRYRAPPPLIAPPSSGQNNPTGELLVRLRSAWTHLLPSSLSGPSSRRELPPVAAPAVTDVTPRWPFGPLRRPLGSRRGSAARPLPPVLARVHAVVAGD